MCQYFLFGTFEFDKHFSKYPLETLPTTITYPMTVMDMNCSNSCPSDKKSCYKYFYKAIHSQVKYIFSALELHHNQNGEKNCGFELKSLRIQAQTS